METLTVRSKRDIINYVNSHPSGSRRARILAFVALGGIFIDAYDFTSLGFGVDSLQKELSLSAFQLGTVTAIMAFGALIGALFGGYLVERVGRYKLFTIDLFLFVVAALGAALSPNLGWLLFFRFCLGVGVGLDMPASLSFVAEFTNSRDKGKYVNFWQMMWYCATVCTGLVALVMFLAGAGGELWRWAVGFGAVPALVVLALRFRYADESPMWAAHHLGLSEAGRILQKNYDVRVEVEPSEEESMRPSRIRFGAIFQPGYRARTALASIISGLQSMEYYAVGFYLPTISALILGKGLLYAILGTTVINLFGILGGGTQAFLTRRLGVWRLAVIGCSVAAASLVVAGTTRGSISVYLEGLLLGIFILAHSFGQGSQGKTMAAMSYPTEFRGVGTGWAEAMSRVGSMLGFYVFPLVLAAAGLSHTILYLAAIPLIMLIFLLVIRWEPVGKESEVEGGLTSTPGRPEAVTPGE
ncbi:MFS transporter [Rubrobacter calidifluminis]|uniref:MFS transporter n=1 Tax=Rubrobacter calidifluminis TaxID=1392640 RepID=UPI0023615D90|nr:MFS transporter [Rubrobacter calidifluminis]